jgi:hypothetical protein
LYDDDGGVGVDEEDEEDEDEEERQEERREEAVEDCFWDAEEDAFRRWRAWS